MINWRGKCPKKISCSSGKKKYLLVSSPDIPGQAESSLTLKSTGTSTIRIWKSGTWSPYLKGDIGKYEAVQHRATRIIPALKELPCQERLKILKFPSLRYRRARGNMIETYKYLHGITKVSTHSFLLSEDRHTRGHSLKLKKVRNNTNRRRMFHSQSIVAGLDTNGCPIAGTTDFKWGQVKNDRQWPPGQ